MDVAVVMLFCLLLYIKTDVEQCVHFENEVSRVRGKLTLDAQTEGLPC